MWGEGGAEGKYEGSNETLFVESDKPYFRSQGSLKANGLTR